MSQSSQVQSVKFGVPDNATTTDNALQSPTTPDGKVASGEEEGERMEAVEHHLTSNESNTLQMREELQRHVEEMKKQILGQPRRRSQRLRTQGERGRPPPLPLFMHRYMYVCTVLYGSIRTAPTVYMYMVKCIVEMYSGTVRRYTPSTLCSHCTVVNSNWNT